MSAARARWCRRLWHLRHARSAANDEQLTVGRAQEQSLACYLPDNLDELTYIPLGMEEAVENFRNRARKGKKRLPQES